jgi:hypothetical protein
VKSTVKRYPFSVEEINAINNGGSDVSWKKVKAIKLSKSSA